jgi:FeoB-associated Cys-rich membrane protein
VDTQLAITGAIVLAAAAYVVRAVLRPIFGRGKVGCGTGCGKCAAPEPPRPRGRIGLPQVPPRG